MTEPAAAGSGRTLRALVLLAVVLVAFFAGMAVERIRFDSRRDDMLRRYNEALRQHREQIMQSEKHSERPSERTLTR